MTIDAIMIFLTGMIFGFIPGAMLTDRQRSGLRLTMTGGDTMISMEERMREGWQRIEVSLEGYHVKPDAMKEIRDEYIYICYQWATTNAAASAFEEYVQMADKELFMHAADPRRTMTYIMNKVRDTIPAEWQGEEI